MCYTDSEWVGSPSNLIPEVYISLDDYGLLYGISCVLVSPATPVMPVTDPPSQSDSAVIAGKLCFYFFVYLNSVGLVPQL